MWVIDWMRTLVYAACGWTMEHADTAELRITPGEHHFAETIEHVIAYAEPRLVDWEADVEEVLHDLGLV